MEGDRNSHNLLQYLTAENRQLKDEREDLRELVQVNKLQIDLLSKNNPSNKYIEVISNYRKAADNYQHKIEQFQLKLDSAISEKLMLEQLNQDSNTELRAIQELHKHRTDSLQSIVQELQKKLTAFERQQKSYDSLTGFVQRNRDIFNPTEQAVEFLAREEQLKEEVHMLKQQVRRGKENQEHLLKVSGILRHKVVTLQAKLAMPNKNLGEILDKSLKRLMMYFIQTQKRILTGEESDSEGEEDLQLIAPQLATYFGEENIRRQQKYGVPHLDLLKIRGSIANGNQKIKEQLLKRNHLSKQERIQRLQIELEYTRRELTKNIIDLREETERRRTLEIICDQLEGRNQLLTRSYERASEKVGNILRRANDNHEKQPKLFEVDQSLTNLNTKHDNNLVDAEDRPQPSKPTPLDTFQTPEEYKIHLRLLARDLAKNTKIQYLSHLRRRGTESKEEWKPRIRRSTSNPFLYFNQRRQDILAVIQPTGRKKQGKGRLQQTAIIGHGLQILGHGEDLEDIDI